MNTTTTRKRSWRKIRTAVKTLAELVFIFLVTIGILCGLGFLFSSPQDNEPWLLYKGTGVALIVGSLLLGELLGRIKPNTRHYRCTQCDVIHIPDYGNSKKLRTRCPVCKKRTVFQRIEEDT